MTSANCICLNGPKTNCPVHGPRARRARAAPPPAERRKLEQERSEAQLQAVFYWLLVERQGTSKTDYEYRAQRSAARALDRQEQLDRMGKAGGRS